MRCQRSVSEFIYHELGISYYCKKRIQFLPLIIGLLLLWLTPISQSYAALSVTGLQQTYRAIGPGANLYQYRYRVQVTNTSATKAYGVSVTATPANTAIFIAKQVLAFGTIEPGASATSSTELTVYAQGNIVASINDVAWSISQVPMPIANAGPDQNVVVNTLVTLDASASSSPAGLALSYTWRMVSKPTGSSAKLNNKTALRPTLWVDKPGRYECELTVKQGPYTSLPDRVIITTGNTQPVADAGPAQTQPVGSLVTLDGSASHDTDGDPLTFYWTFISKPSTSQALLPSPSPVSPSFTLDKPGNYLVQLIVSDGYQQSAPATVTITTQNSPPVAHAGNDQTGYVNDLITLDASASSDVDGDALSYHWSLLSKPEASQAQLSDAHAITPQFILDQPGHYAAQLLVSDAKSTSEADNVTVTTLNSRPVARAGGDQAVSVNTRVTLDGNASEDVDHDNVTYHWQLISKPEGSQAQLIDESQVKPSFVVDKPGSYLVHLTVNDGQLDSEPDSITISTLNSRPVADAGPDQVATSAVIQLTGAASHDADSDTLSYRWSLLSKPDGSQAAIAPVDTVNPRFTADYPGSYISQLIVNDGQLDSLPDTSVIDVSATVFNHAPRITSTAPTIATTGTLYRYLVQATDSDSGDQLTFTLVQAPTGMTLDAATGLLAWQPDSSQLGDHSVTIRVNDRLGAQTEQHFSVTVTRNTATVTVPSVIGQHRSQALAVLIDANLTLGDVRFDYSDNIPTDAIISQTPSASQQAEPGCAVSLVISLGVNAGLPADPEQVAPPINPALPVTPLKQATEFLYTGEHPIQSGVAPRPSKSASFSSI